MNLEIINAASPRHREQMEKLAVFCGAHRVEYKDLGGDGEDYILTKMIEGKDTVLEIRARGNRMDGAFLCIPLKPVRFDEIYQGQ